MKHYANFAVYGRDGRLVLLVEVTGRSGAFADWVAQLRRNMLAPGFRRKRQAMPKGLNSRVRPRSPPNELLADMRRLAEGHRLDGPVDRDALYERGAGPKVA